MLFHITAKHDHTNCTRNKPGKSAVRKFRDTTVVKVIGLWIYGPAHTVYAVVEADSVQILRQALDEMMDMGPIQVDPVMEPPK